MLLFLVTFITTYTVHLEMTTQKKIPVDIIYRFNILCNTVNLTKECE